MDAVSHRKSVETSTLESFLLIVEFRSCTVSLKLCCLIRKESKSQQTQMQVYSVKTETEILPFARTTTVS